MRKLLFGLAAVAFAASASASTVFYSEDFEGGAAGFTFSSLWHVTANYPYAGTGALGFVQGETAGADPNGNYSIGADNGVGHSAFSAPFFVSTTTAHLTMHVFVGDEYSVSPSGYDRLSVGVAVGPASTTIDSVLASSNPMNGGVSIPEWGGTSGYNTIEADLSAYSGQIIRLSFQWMTQDGIAEDYPGPRIDDVVVSAGAVPEPTSMAVLVLGAAGLLKRRVR